MPRETIPADELRRQLEMMAGLVITGPDAPSIEFSIISSITNHLNYQTIMLGGFDNEAQATQEGMMLATMRTFVILGNPIRLMRVPTMVGPVTIQPEPGVPQGQILVWREGRTPEFTIDEGIYSVSMSFAVLPPWATLVNSITPAAARHRH